MFLRSKAKIDNKDTYSNVTIGLLAHTNMFLFLQIETSNSIAATNSIGIEALLCLARSVLSISKSGNLPVTN